MMDYMRVMRTFVLNAISGSIAHEDVKRSSEKIFEEKLTAAATASE